MLIQSQRSAEYEAALDQLRARGLVYACFCTRADIAAALEAPHGDAAAPIIPAPAERCPTTGAARGRRRIAGGSIPRRRSSSPACRHGPRPTARASRPAREDFDDVDPRAQGRARRLSSRLRRRRCRERRHAGRARRRPAPLDAGPAPAADPARPARADLPPPPARHPRGRPPPRQARPGADSRGDAGSRRRRPRARRRPARRASFRLVSLSRDA